jgi:hypothetical protein
MAEDDLAELRAAAVESTLVGVCHAHPERAASLTCERCGDHQCDECARVLADGMCPACVRASEARLAPRGRAIVLAFASIWLALQAWGLWTLWERQVSQPALLLFGLFTLVLGLCLLVAMQYGSSAAHHAWVTWLGLGAVLNLMGGNLVLGAPSLVFAGLLLSPSVSAYVATRARDRPR